MQKLTLDPAQIRDAERRAGVNATDLLQRYNQRDGNIVGVAYGPRMRGGKEEANEACVTFFVGKKRHKDKLDKMRMVPVTVPELEGAPTDVIEVGAFRASSPTGPKYRPALGGASISGIHENLGGTSVNSESGTLACRAYREGILGGRKRWFALSNAHVMAQMDGSGAVGDVISQPSYLDSVLWQDNRIGTLSAWLPISATAINYVDAAIAAIDHNNSMKSRLSAVLNMPIVSDGILELGQLTEWRHWYNIRPGLAVAKRGAGLPVVKRGQVSHILGSYYVEYNGTPCLFEAQIAAEMLTVGGDSGSLMVTEEVSGKDTILPTRPHRLGAVGLVFATNTQGTVKYTLANYIEAVHLLLNVQVADQVYTP